MTRTPSCPLLDMLAEVPEPRKKKGCRYPLKAMLGVLVVGLLCGHTFPAYGSQDTQKSRKRYDTSLTDLNSQLTSFIDNS